MYGQLKHEDVSITRIRDELDSHNVFPMRFLMKCVCNGLMCISLSTRVKFKLFCILLGNIFVMLSLLFFFYLTFILFSFIDDGLGL